MEKELDLSQVFKAVSQKLVENQETLNNADAHNHDHGTNMVNTFKLIEEALETKKDESASDQLAFASQLLREKSSSGSAMLYADGLGNASQAFEGKTFDRAGIGTLLNALMGSSPSPTPVQTQAEAPSAPQSGDFLSTLIGGLASGQNQTAPQPQAQTPPSPQETTFSQTPDLIDALGGLTFSQETPQHQSQQTPQGSATDLVSQLLGGLGQNQTAPAPQQEVPSGGLGDLLGSLLGGSQAQAPAEPAQPSGGLGDLLGSLLGGQASPAPTSQNQGGPDGTNLLSAALAYFMAKQEGKTPFESILQAVSSGSRFSDREDRSQSGALVADTLLGMLSK